MAAIGLVAVLEAVVEQGVDDFWAGLGWLPRFLALYWDEKSAVGHAIGGCVVGDLETDFFLVCIKKSDGTRAAI